MAACRYERGRHDDEGTRAGRGIDAAAAARGGRAGSEIKRKRTRLKNRARIPISGNDKWVRRKVFARAVTSCIASRRQFAVKKKKTKKESFRTQSPAITVFMGR